MKSSRPRTSTLIIQVSAVIGLLDSIYLAYVKIAKTPIYCTPGLGDCDVVNASRWSILFGIPLGFYGVVGFGLIFILATFGLRQRAFHPYIDLILFGFSLAGFLFSLYLTSIEIFVLKTVCQWCLLSAMMMSVIFITTIIRLVVKSPSTTASGGK
jgi:uncharacterized membrane protein